MLILPFEDILCRKVLHVIIAQAYLASGTCYLIPDLIRKLRGNGGRQTGLTHIWVVFTGGGDLARRHAVCVEGFVAYSASFICNDFWQRGKLGRGSVRERCTNDFNQPLRIFRSVSLRSIIYLGGDTGSREIPLGLMNTN